MQGLLLRWRFVGVLTGLSAIVLAGLGAFLSIRQTQALTNRLIDQVRGRAEQCAQQVSKFASEPSQDLESEVITSGNGSRKPVSMGGLIADAKDWLATEKNLCLVQGEAASAHWAAPLSGKLKGWAVAPCPEFMDGLSWAALSQTAIHVGLTAPAVAALLIAVWFAMRLAKREIALAELKANFVADVSHELKTPLALIRLYAETLQAGRIPTEEKRQEYYGVIARESERLTHLINDILDFSKIEAGRKDYVLRTTDVARVVQDTYDAYRPQLDQHAFEHHLTIATDVPSIDADPDAIAQVLVNLINNAIKYSQGEKYLAIDVATDIRRGRRGVLVSVHDRGIGIRPEDRARLTDGFFRASDDRVRQQGGTGLGLALVKRIVEAHNGSLDIESRLVKGSSFRVFLPASEGGVAKPQV